MNKILQEIFSVMLYPLSLVIRMVQNKMDFLRNYKLKLLIAQVIRFIRILNGTTSSVQFSDSLYPSSNSSTTTKIGFVDHSYHYKTVSSSFFIDLLVQFGSVKVIWDSQWNGGRFPLISSIDREEFDFLILWQIMIYHDPEKLRKLRCKNIIIIPMYDDIHADPDKLFLKFKDFRFISFCKALQQRFEQLGINSKYFQYFIAPILLPFYEEPFTDLKGFFWQRTNDITWATILKLIEGSDFSSFHLHLALDPIWYKEVLPTEAEILKYHITITRWFDKREDYLAALSRANVFFTPRLYEGIGMPVIETLTMGKLVVAPDHPTMNEYITNGINGLLYHVQDPKPLNFTFAKAMAVQARKDCLKGFEKWEKDRLELAEWIFKP